MVQCRVNVGPHGELLFTLGKTRPKTQYGRKQAAHVTAYAVFTRVLLQAIDSRPVHDLPHFLTATASCFLTNTDTLLDIQNMFEKEAKEGLILNREERKQLTRRCRLAGQNEADVRAIKYSIKVNHANFIARLVEKLATTIITELNTEEATTFLKLSASDPSTLGTEGAQVRRALEQLSALETYAKWAQSTSSQEANKWSQRLQLEKSRLAHFKNYAPIANWLKKMKADKTNAESASFFSTSTATPDPKEWQNGLPEGLVGSVVNLFAALFDMDYYDRLAVELLNHYQQQALERVSLTHTKASLNQLIQHIKTLADKNSRTLVEAFHWHAGLDNNLQSSQQALKEAVAKLITYGEQTDKATQEGKVHPFLKGKLEKHLRDTEDNLTESFLKSCNRHFIFMHFAFPSMLKPSSEQTTSLVKQYISTLSDQQSWNTINEDDLSNTQKSIIEKLTQLPPNKIEKASTKKINPALK